MDKTEFFIESIKTTLIIFIVFIIGFVTGAMVYEQENREIKQEYEILLDEYNENLYMYKKKETENEL